MTGWVFALRSLYGAVLLLAPARALATLTHAPQAACRRARWRYLWP